MWGATCLLLSFSRRIGRVGVESVMYRSHEFQIPTPAILNSERVTKRDAQ